MKKLFYLISFMTLFLGINVLYTLGLKDPFNTTTSLTSSVHLATWLLLGEGMYLLTKKKLNKKNEYHFIFFCIIYIIFNVIILRRSANLVLIINSFIAPIFASLYAKNFHQAKNFIFKIIILYFITECGLAITERITSTNFLVAAAETTFMDTSMSDTEGFRSASIHGHPLQGALMISVVMGFIYISEIKIKTKIILLLLGCMALLSFNTRSSICFWGGMLSLLLLHIIFSNKYSTGNKLASFCLLSIASIGLWNLLQSGWGGRLLELSLFDEDSAQARIDVFLMFDFISVEQILWGITEKELISIMSKSGIGIIENYWISYILSFGIIGTIFFVVFVFRCLKPLFKNIPIIKIVISVGSFLLISSTNNSMVSGVPALILLVLCVYSFPIKRNNHETIYQYHRTHL